MLEGKSQQLTDPQPASVSLHLSHENTQFQSLVSL